MAVQWPFLCMAVAPPLTEEEQKTHSNDGDVITAESDVSDGSFIADHPVQWSHLRPGVDAARQDDVTVARGRGHVVALYDRPVCIVKILTTFRSKTLKRM